MVVPSTADVINEAVSALSSFVGKDGVTFHNSLPVVLCVREVLKTWGAGCLSSVREEFESLAFISRESWSSDLAAEISTPRKTAILPSHFIVTVTRGPEVSRVHSLPGLCGVRVMVENYVPLKSPMHFRHCQRFGHTQKYFGHVPRCIACGGRTTLGTALSPGAASEMQLRG
jgi:hypothetical protein